MMMMTNVMHHPMMRKRSWGMATCASRNNMRITKSIHQSVAQLPGQILAPNSLRLLQARHHTTGRASFDISSSSSSSPPPPPKNPFVDGVVDRLNDAIKKSPAETIAVLFASDIGSIFGMYSLLSFSGLEFSPEFALAFAASRPFRRIRLPLDLAFAAVVARVVPAFSRVQLSQLTGALPTNPNATTMVSSSPIISQAVESARKIIDTYGAAYMMGSRLAGVSVVTCLYLAISSGVDVMPLLQKLGVAELGTALGSWAAAVVFSSAFYPVTLGFTGYIVPVLAKARRVLMTP